MQIHPYPNPGDLRRCQPWQPRPRPPATRERVAYHEAGHIVLMQWVGLAPPLATIEEGEARIHGAAHWPGSETLAALPEPSADEDGALVATAAAVFHAGVMAEMAAHGIPWAGPVFYVDETDYQSAEAMLFERFGRHASGAHAFAQRVALHVITGRWADVEKIAAELVTTGTWRP